MTSTRGGQFAPDTGGQLHRILHYVITKPIHPSQKNKNDPTGLEVKIKVIPNFELERLILSFGEQVKVISPQDFKERISQRLKSAGRLY